MSEKEKIIIKKLKETIPKMSDYQKGYLLGMVENMADNSDNDNNEKNNDDNS